MTDWQRAALRRGIWPGLVALIGIVLVIVGGSGDLMIIGGGVIGVAVTIVIALVFLEIGYSEDRERERR